MDVFEATQPQGAVGSDDVHADLRGRLSEAYGASHRSPVAVASGYGVRVSVERGHLTVVDGVGDTVRTRRWSRANHGLSRLVVIASTGAVGLEALKWCAGAGIGVVVLDPFDGELLLTSGGCGNNDPRLRRAQALAIGTETGLAVARYLIVSKLEGQSALAGESLGAPDTANSIAALAEMVADAGSLEEVRQLEASAANLYFAAWSRLDIRFIRRDSSRIPEHWGVFEGRRSSVFPGSARSATDPLNAMLNYGYRLLEAEGRIACLRIGIDPGLGVLHADLKCRDSLVLDLIEAARPSVDRSLFDLLGSVPLRKRDFVEDSRGVVRLLPPLTHKIAAGMPTWAAGLAPVVEHVAEIFAAGSAYDISVATLLSRQKHKAAARRRTDEGLTTDQATAFIGPNPGGLVPRAKRRQQPRHQPSPQLPLPICRGCGAALPQPADRLRARRTWCDRCGMLRRQELDVEMRGAADEVAQNFRVVQGVLPSHTPDAQQRRIATNRRRQLARLAWEADHGGAAPDVEWYLVHIAPRLTELSLTEIAGAIGVSTSSASKFRRGLRVPAPRHWALLSDLVGASSSAGGQRS